jgi:DNA polymerase alpha subunit B
LKEVAPPETVTPTAKSVVSRPSMAKRTVANIETPSPSKRLKDGQLEHIISNAQSSPLKNGGMTSALVTPNVRNAYENRKNSGQIIASYNPANLPPLEAHDARTSVIEVMEPSLTKPYKYMTDKPVHHALNSRLEDMSQEILQRYLNENDKDEENMDMGDIFEQVGVPRQSVQFNVGRICNESHSGKINSTTILLEGSRSGSNGARISVDVSQLENYSLFPGQIVGVKGMNLSGRKIMAEEIIEGIEDNNGERMMKTKRSILKDTNKNALGTKIFTVAGPYTTENLEYKPLENLLEKVVTEKPDVVIMMGPFVDMRMEKIANGEMTVEFVDGDGNFEEKVVSYEAFFAAKISSVLESLFEDMKDDIKTQFVMVPSTDDAIAEPV